MSWTTNIQWKGTDLCMDFVCPECGEQSHFDGMFAYAIECPYCRSQFEMPSDVSVKKIERGTCPCVLTTEVDE